MRLWQVESGKELRRFEGHTDYIWNVAISPDGRLALSGSGSSAGKDNTVRLWDLETGKELQRFEGHSAQVATVSFSADGRRALSSSPDGTVRLWALPK
jgi:WD40 repeat protein